jgi:hypothetical protein
MLCVREDRWTRFVFAEARLEEERQASEAKRREREEQHLYLTARVNKPFRVPRESLSWGHIPGHYGQDLQQPPRLRLGDF